MTYVRVLVNKERYEMREKSVALDCGSFWVYAPKSKIIVDKEYCLDLTEKPVLEILVPMWGFTKGHYCWVKNVTGYCGTENI